MKKITFILFLALLALAFPQSARAVEFEDGENVPPALVAPLMAWVEAQTGVRVPALPRVLASHSKMMIVIRHMGNLPGRARALYMGGAVLVDSYSFDSEDYASQSLLIHELVHYAQSFKQSGWPCPQAKETEAYTLQNKWLEEQGHSPFVTVSWINRMAACPATPATTTVAMAQAD